MTQNLGFEDRHSQGQIPILPFTYCVSWNKLLNLSDSFPFVKMG